MKKIKFSSIEIGNKFVWKNCMMLKVSAKDKDNAHGVGDPVHLQSVPGDCEVGEVGAEAHSPSATQATQSTQVSPPPDNNKED